MKHAKAKYFVSAGTLGVIWFLVLLIPLATREVLLPQETRTLEFLAVRVFLVAVTSVILAVAFKRFIVRTQDVWLSSLVSLVLPLVGTLIFVLVEFLTLLSRENLLRVGWEQLMQILFVRLIMSVPIGIHYAFYVMVPMGFISQYVMNRAGRSDGRASGRAFCVITLTTIILGAGCMAWVKQLDGIRTLTYEMVWDYGPPAEQCRGTKHILLRFVDFPSDMIGICSQDLGNYLESLASNKVPVTFEVTYDLRSVRGFREVKIGTLTRWNEVWSYNQSQGERKRSPWDP